MKPAFRIIAVILILLVGLAVARKILRKPPHKAAASEHEAAAPEYPRGPHNGRLLTDGDLVIELHRFLGRVDGINFKKEGDYLAGDKVVEEPHSFDVKVMAEYNGRKSQWTYQSYEGRVTMPPAAIETAGIKIEEAGSAKLRTLVQMNGKIAADPDKVAHVTPRFPGIILQARKKLGDHVTQGEVLAVVESNESLRPYDIKSQIAGQVIKRDAVLGESVSQSDTLYVVADLSSVALELA